MKLTTQVVLAVLCFSAVGNVQATLFERVLNIACPGIIASNIVDQWIQQKLDHFDASETRTWPMRYLANKIYFENGGPIFVLIGGEWEILRNSLLCGHFHDMAKNNNGYLFYIEHRYYGKSNPTDGLSMANAKDKFKYLNAKQALADLEHFIRTMKETTPGLRNSKVIIAGKSYAGSLAVWLKNLHPNLVDGAWASSAPLMAKFEISEAQEFIFKQFRELGSVECYERIKKAFVELKDMLKSDQAPNFLNKDFNKKNPLDRQSLYEKILNNIAENGIANTCALVMKEENYVPKLLVIGDYYGDNGLSFKNTLQMFSSSESLRSTYTFLYQRCNEFGWFWTFRNVVPSSYFAQKCAELFGEEFTEDNIKNKIEKTNEIFGGLSINMQNIYMTHGEYDPWKFVGLNDETIIIPGGRHGTDFKSISSGDSKEIKASKKQVAEKVREWVRQ